MSIIGRLQELDFIKGIAIISVILLHSVSGEWLLASYAFFHIWQAVPLFILVSYVLLFKKLERCTLSEYYLSIGKICKRVVVPFLLIEAMLLCTMVYTDGIEQTKIAVRSFGAGPGSYYPYVYMQLWLTAPLLYHLLRNNKWGGVILLTINILINVLLWYFLGSGRIYSLSLARYLLIPVLAYYWCFGKVRLEWIAVFSIISGCYYFSRVEWGGDYTPFIDSRWGTQQFPAFFYTLFLLMLLYKAYPVVHIKCKRLMEALVWCGRNSYEIFLMQMFWIACLSGKWEVLSNSYGWFGRMLYVAAMLSVSILPVVFYNWVKAKKR